MHICVFVGAHVCEAIGQFDLARLAGQQGPEISLSPSPQCCGDKCMFLHTAFFWKIYLYYSFESFMHSFYIFLLYPLIPLTAPRSTHSPHPSLLLFFFYNPPSPVSTAHDSWCVITHWGVIDTLGDMLSKKTHSPFLSGCQLSIAPQLGLVVYEPHRLFASNFFHTWCESELG